MLALLSMAPQVCRFYLQGNCRFGERCKNIHPVEGQQRSQAPFGGRANNANPSNRGRDNQSSSEFERQQNYESASNSGFGRNNYRSNDNSLFDRVDNQSQRGTSTRGGRGGASARGQGRGNSSRPFGVSSREIEEDLSLDNVQWPLSCYGPGKDAADQLFGGEPIETSPEELRLTYYLAAAQGNPQAGAEHEQHLCHLALERRAMVRDNIDAALDFLDDSRDKKPNRVDNVRSVRPPRGEFFAKHNWRKRNPRQNHAAGFGGSQQAEGFDPFAPSPNSNQGFAPAPALAPAFGGFGSAPTAAPAIDPFGAPTNDRMMDADRPMDTSGPDSAAATGGGFASQVTGAHVMHGGLGPVTAFGPVQASQPSSFGMAVSQPTQTSSFGALAPQPNGFAAGDANAVASGGGMGFGQSSTGAPTSANAFGLPPPNAFGQGGFRVAPQQNETQVTTTATNGSLSTQRSHQETRDARGQLKIWQQQPVVLKGSAAYVRRRDGKEERVWHPGTNDAETALQQSLTSMSEVPAADQYPPEAKSLYEAALSQGTFAGKVPELAPRPEWCDYHV